MGLYCIIITVIITIKVISMKTKRYSKQRETILKILQNTKSHPTASYIYDEARKEIPNISLGTVYRNLKELSKEGQILALKGSDDSEHYDGFATSHPHLYCKTCERIVDLDLPFVNEFVGNSSKNCGIEISSHNILFFGKCAQCKAE